jgi:hypothetical protein
MQATERKLENNYPRDLGLTKNPSREAGFSSALSNITQDWKEQTEAIAAPKSGRLLRISLLAPILYAMSMVPFHIVLAALGYPYRGVLVFKYVYCPIIWLMQGHIVVAILLAVTWVGYGVVLWYVSRR